MVSIENRFFDIDASLALYLIQNMSCTFETNEGYGRCNEIRELMWNAISYYLSHYIMVSRLGGHDRQYLDFLQLGLHQLLCRTVEERNSHGTCLQETDCV